MERSIEEPQSFQYELSAFLSAARSVLQYAYEEASGTSSGRQWYETEVSGEPILKFFKDKRNLNIHEEPIKPSRQIAISHTEHISISEAIRIEIRKEDGSIEVHEEKGELPSARPTETDETGVRIRYVFDDWLGSEDVIDLSYQYLQALERFTQAGLRSRAISG